ncbi:MAG: hydroxyethylthiazole kinase [Candidatus Geothermincolales bacterium]
MKADEIRGLLRESLRKVAETRPLVHHITNYVVMNDTANLTLCLGALPVMAHAQEEVEEMASQAHAVVLNMGTPSPAWEKSLLLAGKKAAESGKPVVLDPVGAGATSYRTRLARTLVEEVRPTVIRGNVAEIASLLGLESEIRGVESLSSQDPCQLARQAAEALRCVVAVTGEKDAVSDGERTYLVANGHPMLGRITGTGCMATTAVAVLLCSGGPALELTAGALALFGLAGEEAARIAGERPGTFRVELFDSLHRLTGHIPVGRLLVEEA